MRCIAILLVLFYHARFLYFFSRVGWVGVDLFFVLSGFLISGLLFGEYQKRGSIRVQRFFIRRALKIYPAFYALLAFTACMEYFRHHFSPGAEYLHEAFFVQSYWRGIWIQTWSLAVEEHFYILLPFFLLALIRFSSNRADPYRAIPKAFLIVALLCQASRASSAFTSPPDFDRVYYASHNRLDTLFFGVLIGYFYHFRREMLDRFMWPVWIRVSMAMVSAAFLSCAYFFYHNSQFFGAIGYALTYLGCGGVLLLSLYVHDVLPRPLRTFIKPIGTAAAGVGKYSYSIYLWFGPVGAYLLGLFPGLFHVSLGPYENFALFIVECLLVGIVMSVAIEYPILRVRNRLFPSPNDNALTSPENVPEPQAPSVQPL